jgi:hypothetical protein
MSKVRRIRALLHLPYLRAAVVALALVAAAGGLGTVILELRFGVPAQAVIRYFARLHSNADDLTPFLRRPTTLAALGELSYASSGMNAGGLVYSDEGRLLFHHWMPQDAALAANLRSGENQTVYSRLLPKYLAAELDGLIAELSHPETRRSLGQVGVSPLVVEELRRQASDDPDPAQRVHLLRRAAKLIRPFMPSGADRHQLQLVDKLRFYSTAAPRGRYVGLYEVRGPSWLSPAAPDTLPGSGRLLAITKEPDGRILVEDLRPSGRRVYRLTPVDHPAGLPMYRLGRRA